MPKKQLGLYSLRHCNNSAAPSDIARVLSQGAWGACSQN